MKILVTGCAGFIGSHLTDRLLEEGFDVVGVDDFNDYYDPKIKEQNLQSAKKNRQFKLCRKDVLDFTSLEEIFKKEKPAKVVHLAARAGVRASIENPLLYAKVNVAGTVHLLKLSVDFGIKQFIFGSSSSIYGNTKRIPFSEDDICDSVISPYGASKRSAEFFVESFWKNYHLKSIILRFFTVYGPRGRPDMAPALFTKAILNNEELTQFGNGSSSRDYTYVDDIVNGIIKTLEQDLDFEIINLGNNNSIALRDLIKAIEKVMGKKAKINEVPMQQGDVEKTWANINKAKDMLGWQPGVKFVDGMKKTYEYFCQF